jgi:hypothetical protein
MKNILNIDFEFIEKLKAASGYNREGSSLHFPAEALQEEEEQVRFKKQCLEKYKPNYILETGTNKAEFCYLAKLFLPSCKIITFDIQQWSGKCVELVNEHFGNEDVTFIQGNTHETFGKFSRGTEIGFAHVDGGHDYATAYSDLQNCDRLNIPYVLVDDYRGIGTVTNAVNTFCEMYPYSQIDQDDESKDLTRGLVLLKRTGEQI